MSVRWSLAGVLVFSASVGCMSAMDRAHIDAGAQVFNEVQKAGHQNELTQPGTGGTVYQFRAGTLRQGSAVMVDYADAAFWVKDGKVYVVNEEAKGLLPEGPQAPAEVTYKAVDEAAE